MIKYLVLDTFILENYSEDDFWWKSKGGETYLLCRVQVDGEISPTQLRNGFDGLIALHLTRNSGRMIEMLHSLELVDEIPEDCTRGPHAETTYFIEGV